MTVGSAVSTGSVIVGVAVGGRADELTESTNVVAESVDIFVGVHRGDRPLFALAPRRHEHSAVVLDEEVQVAETGVHRQELTAVERRLFIEDQGALEAERVSVGRNAVPL